MIGNLIEESDKGTEGSRSLYTSQGGGAVVECSITCPPLSSSLGCSVRLLVFLSMHLQPFGAEVHPRLLEKVSTMKGLPREVKSVRLLRINNPVLKHLSKSTGNVEVYYLCMKSPTGLLGILPCHLSWSCRGEEKRLGGRMGTRNRREMGSQRRISCAYCPPGLGVATNE